MKLVLRPWMLIARATLPCRWPWCGASSLFARLRYGGGTTHKWCWLQNMSERCGHHTSVYESFIHTWMFGGYLKLFMWKMLADIKVEKESNQRYVLGDFKHWCNLWLVSRYWRIWLCRQKQVLSTGRTQRKTLQRTHIFSPMEAPRLNLPNLPMCCQEGTVIIYTTHLMVCRWFSWV